MFGNLEVANRAKRDLADTIGGAILDIGQLAVLGHLAAAEHGPAGMLQRRLGHVSVLIMPNGDDRRAWPLPHGAPVALR